MSRELLKEILATLEGNDDYYFLRGKIRRELAKPEPEPACFANTKDLKMVTEKIGSGGFIAQPTHLTNTNVNGNIPLYTSPPARKPLTEAEINNIWVGTGNGFEFARAIENAHGIDND
jgi:hypothetical protein